MPQRIDLRVGDYALVIVLRIVGRFADECSVQMFGPKPTQTTGFSVRTTTGSSRFRALKTSRPRIDVVSEDSKILWKPSS